MTNLNISAPRLLHQPIPTPDQIVDQLYAGRIFVPANEFRRAFSMGKTRFYERINQKRLTANKDGASTVIYRAAALKYVIDIISGEAAQ